jgi:DNA polymerase III gamma/tau subunit
LLSAWVDHDLAGGLKIINRAVDGGADPRQLARQTADFLRGLLLIRLGAAHTWTDPTVEERELFTEMAQKTDPDRIVEAVRRFSDVAAKQRTGWQPQLPLELAFVEAVMQPAPSLQATQPTAPAGRVRESAASAMPSAPAPARARPREAVDARVPQASQHTRTPTTTRETDEQAATPAAAPSENSSPADELPSENAAALLDQGTVATIKANWSELIRQVQPIALGALLRDAIVGGTDPEGRLVLTFQHAFHCEKVSQESNLRRVEELLARSFHQQVVVRCLLMENWVPSTGSAPAGKTGTGARRRSDAIPPEEDELIRRAQEELGAVARTNA